MPSFEQNDGSADDIDRSETSAGPGECCVPRESHNQPEPVYSPANSFVRTLTEEEIGRLQESLGRPIDRAYLVRWVSQAIRDVVRLSQLPTAREYRDGLLQMREEGRRWIQQVEACPGTSFIPAEVAELKRVVTRFSDQVDLLANKFVVKRGRRTPLQAHLIKAIKGDARSASLVINLVTRLGLLADTENEPLTALPEEDQAILEDYVRSKTGPAASKARSQLET